MPIDLRSHLRTAYSRASWTAILTDLFPSGSLHLLQHPEHIAAPCEFVTRTQQLGSVQLPDGNQIALLEVEVEDQVQLARNRVALRNFVAKFIDEAATQAVLAVFHQPGKENGSGASTAWRLTYASKRSQLDEDTLEITSTHTAPRRYTFLLGEGEPCRTAAGRLAEIRERGGHLTLEDVEKAFSVERLNKEFFKKYKEHYDAFVSHLLAPERVKAVRTAFSVPALTAQGTERTTLEQDKADKPIRDFVKRLLGRLVFLHFLQKKGWMGCKPGGKAWTGGDTDFLASYFTLAEKKGEAEHFHSRWLLPLFFEALNKDHDERPGHLFAPTGTRIPYLNGGLFEASDVERAFQLVPPAERTGKSVLQLDFPAAHFRALLDFFGQYHFTIDENDPEDHEVGIDPEMLGHIFENLLEDNKDKGAYYTPKAIVSYMARQSLLHYLQTHLGENAELVTLLNEKDLTRLEKNGFVHQHAKRIAELLDAVKVCDPAIGSGAFPIGVLQEILWTRLALDWTLNTPEDRARLKRQIIQNSIHGVDLDPGAVEIARLRFWLALVVDEDQPRPLPNLDYKIHRADSLIEYIRGEPVSMAKQPPNNARFVAARDHLVAAKHRLFTAQRVPEKRDARFDLYRSLAELGEEVFTWMKLETDFTDGERLASLTAAAREFHHRLTLIDGRTKQPAKTQDQILAALRDWFDDEKKPTFLWQLHFGEVFAQGGFDIVIANPPYVRHETISDSAPLLRERFSVAASRADLLIFFYEQAVNLLEPGGTLTFITSNKYFRAGYGSKLRPFLSSKLTLHSLVDFGDAPVFDAIAYASILIGSRTAPASGHDISVCNWPPDAPIHQLLSVLNQNAFALAQKSLDPNGWSLEKRDSLALLAKLRARGKPLADYVGGKFYWGVRTGLNEAYVIDETTRNRLIKEHKSSAALIKPYLRGRDVTRWKIDHQRLYLIAFPFGFHSQLEGYPAILKHLQGFEADLKKRGQCTSSRGGKSQGQHHWLELDNNPKSEFLAAFDQPKIVIPAIADRPSAAFDNTGLFSNNKTSIAVCPDGSWITGVINSMVCRWFASQVFATKQNGYFDFEPRYSRQFPIPPATAADKARLSELAEKCAAAAQRGDEETQAVHEAEIDEIVYRLFDLTPEEITLIETSLAPTREKKPARRKGGGAARSVDASKTTSSLQP
ncbi:MAG: Eco57I restriction-modification methylase domain-containing protein [Verrucomicrobiaceae bacterium]|nr:Eco57I restriction-modification methylase domain-containing protein [Verrucomicrobiaceae bacterium]